MARRMPPIWFILKNGRSWPGLVFPEPWPYPAPDGYEFVYDRYGILKYANDGSPYITNGSETISYYAYQNADYWVLRSGFWDLGGDWFSDRMSWS